MAKIALVCLRDWEQSPEFLLKLERLNQRLSPDNIVPNSPLVVDNNRGVLFAIFNPNEALVVKGDSVCLGNMIAPPDDWSKPMTEAPDGTYALFRSDENAVELVTDSVASRTIWYILTEEVFIAATSQRAIISLLGSFEPNRITVSWMLSSGTLGPDNSWDRRIKMVGADGRVLLNRFSWKLTVRQESLDSVPLDLPTIEHKNRLQHALEETFDGLQLDYSKWILPLSGGFDSRTILIMLLRKERRLRSVTWGLQSSLNDELNDAYIAKTLANHFDLEHRYFEINISDEPIETIINRYLVAGEGRVDHIRAYMDGFKIWKFLFEEGVSGIIRGDQSFPWGLAYTHFGARRGSGLSLLSDYANLKNWRELELPKQKVPENLEKKPGESLANWRDRLHLEFKLSVYLAALNDLKCPYVEITNPLLTRRIIQQVRTMPSSLKTNKRLLKELIHDIGPDIRFAKREAIAPPKYILQNRSVVDLVVSELNSTYVETLLSKKLVNFIVENIEIFNENSEPKDSRKQSLPQKLTQKVKRVLTKPNIGINTLAFRAFIVCKMSQILHQDAEAFKNGSTKSEVHFAPHEKGVKGFVGLPKNQDRIRI